MTIGTRDAAGRVGALSGWRRHGLAALLGVAAAAALPPFQIVPLVAPAFIGLMWLIDGAEGRRAAFASGWWFGVGFFALGLHWIAYAFLVDAERFAWLIPIALFALSAGLALFTGIVGLVAWMAGRPGPARALALAGAWAGAEMARGYVLTGFPWNLIAYVWTPLPAMMQPAALIGAYGLGAVTVFLCALPGTSGFGRHAWRPAAVAAGLLAVVWAGGAARLMAAGPVEAIPTVPGVLLRLVQANIPQTLKWKPELREAHLRRYIAMSLEPGRDAVTHVIWPETASAYSLDWDGGARALVAAAAPPDGAVLTGAPRTTPPTNPEFRVWNSLFAIGADGTAAAIYDKAHLVPFGEYVPLRTFLPVEKITPGATDFDAGPGPQTLSVPGLPPFAPLICYEVIFSGRVTEPGRRPGWLLNITNDAWFGDSAGPYQHFASARWRAVEEGLPLVRVAVTGISAVVDPYGRTVSILGIGKVGVLDARLPDALAEPPLFSVVGNAASLLIVGMALGFAIVLQRRG